MAFDYVRSDLDDLMTYLKKEGLLPPSWSDKHLRQLKKVHKVVYSFAIWDHNLSRLPEHRRAFLRELRSDSVQVIPLMLMGFMKPVSLLERGILENALKYVYYYDHSVEYAKLCTRTGQIVHIDTLCDYAKSHPTLAGRIDGFNVISNIRNKYTELSEYVHSKPPIGMQLRKCLSAIKFEEEHLKGVSDRFDVYGKNVNILLAGFLKERFDRFNLDHRRFILSLFGKSDKRRFRELF